MESNLTRRLGLQETKELVKKINGTEKMFKDQFTATRSEIEELKDMILHLSAHLGVKYK